MQILFAAPNLPYPATSGGAQRTAALLEALTTMGDVDYCFLPASLKDRRDYTIENATVKAITATDEIRNAWAGRLGAYLPKPLQACLFAEQHRWQPYKPLIDTLGDLSRYDLIVARYLSAACMLDLFRHPRLLIDVDDYDPDRLKLRIASSGVVKNLTLRRAHKHSLLAHESKLPHAAHCWVSNPQDKKHTGLKNATLLPNIPYFENNQLPGIGPPAPDSSTLLMVGTFSYSANIAGAERFLREAWPIIKQTAPNAKIQLVGKGLNKRTVQRWSGIPGVSVRGFVKDLAPLYQNCEMTISPIMSGAGTNIKVLESAAYGRTPVISKVAQRGLETHFIHRKSCLAADTIAQMAASCIELLGNHKLNHRIASKAYQEIQNHYTRKQFNIAVRTAIEKVTS